MSSYKYIINSDLSGVINKSLEKNFLKESFVKIVFENRVYFTCIILEFAVRYICLVFESLTKILKYYAISFHNYCQLSVDIIFIICFEVLCTLSA